MAASTQRGSQGGRKSPKVRTGPKAQDSFAESNTGSDDGNINPAAVEVKLNSAFCYQFPVAAFSIKVMFAKPPPLFQSYTKPNISIVLKSFSNSVSI